MPTDTRAGRAFGTAAQATQLADVPVPCCSSSRGCYAPFAWRVTTTADPALASLHDELVALPGVTRPRPRVPHADGASRLMVTLHLKTPFGDLAFYSTVATFGTAVDITLAELSIETFFPADPSTSVALRSSSG